MFMMFACLQDWRGTNGRRSSYVRNRLKPFTLWGWVLAASSSSECKCHSCVSPDTPGWHIVVGENICGTQRNTDNERWIYWAAWMCCCLFHTFDVREPAHPTDDNDRECQWFLNTRLILVLYRSQRVCSHVSPVILSMLSVHQMTLWRVCDSVPWINHSCFSQRTTLTEQRVTFLHSGCLQIWKVSSYCDSETVKDSVSVPFLFQSMWIFLFNSSESFALITKVWEPGFFLQNLKLSCQEFHCLHVVGMFTCDSL